MLVICNPGAAGEWHWMSYCFLVASDNFLNLIPTVWLYLPHNSN